MDLRSLIRLPAVLVSAVLSLASPQASAQQSSSTARAIASLGDLSTSLEGLAERVQPSVVQIFVTGYVPAEGLVKGDDSLLSRQHSSGSGVIVDPDGYIVTSAHVVQNATRVQVEVPPAGGAPDAKSILKARGRLVGAQIVALDLETDLAVLKVAAAKLPALPFGDSDALKPGQLVLAFGSPLGLANSVTMGIVSATARQLKPEDPMIYVQTDAPINPGNSGGALVDTAGRLVGINALILSQSGGDEGVGFAAPSNIVRNVFEQIRKTGRIRRGDIGIRPQTITPALAAGLGLARDWGAIVSDVYPGGPAEYAGLRPGDIVTALDGKPMENGRQLRINLYGRTIGEEVTLEVERDGRRLAVRVAIAERDDDPSRFAALVTPEQHLVDKLGVLALDIEGALARMLPNLRQKQGVVVAATVPATPVGAEDQLLPGDVIYAVNKTSIANLAQLRQALGAVPPGGTAVLQVERKRELAYLVVALD
jgi:serine protease Do